MNSWTGSTEMEALEEGSGFRVFLKEKDFAATTPAGIWIFIDEHVLTLSDGWFLVTMNNQDPFERLPATRHLNCYCLNFADGHAEAYHLLTPITQIPETQAQAFSQSDPPSVSFNNPDWLKLCNATTTK